MKIFSDKAKNKAIKLRIYPFPSQINIIESTFGACRFIYNNYLEERSSFYNNNVKPFIKSYSKNQLNSIYKSFKRTSDKD